MKEHNETPLQSKITQIEKSIAQKQRDHANNATTEGINYSNSGHYAGQVDELNKRHGFGKLTLPKSTNNPSYDSAVFEGIFNKGAMVEGTITYKKGSQDVCKFTGTFNANGMWSDGIFEKGPAKYVGVFANQQMNGQEFNVIWSDSGIRYKGPIVANKLQGEGKMFFSSGNIRKIEGLW